MALLKQRDKITEVLGSWGRGCPVNKGKHKEKGGGF